MKQPAKVVSVCTHTGSAEKVLVWVPVKLSFLNCQWMLCWIMFIYPIFCLSVFFLKIR